MDKERSYVAPMILGAINPYLGLAYLGRDRMGSIGRQVGEYGRGAVNALQQIPGALGGFLQGVGRYIRPEIRYGSQVGMGPTYGPVGPPAPMPQFDPNQQASWNPGQPVGRNPNYVMPGVNPYRSQSVSSDRGLGLSQTLGSQVAMLEYMAAQQNRPYQIER